MCQSSRIYSSSIYFTALLFTLYASMVVRPPQRRTVCLTASLLAADAPARSPLCRRSDPRRVLVWPELYAPASPPSRGSFSLAADIPFAQSLLSSGARTILPL